MSKNGKKYNDVKLAKLNEKSLKEISKLRI